MNFLFWNMHVSHAYIHIVLTKASLGMACPRPKEARRTRLDADDIADKQTTSPQTDAVADKQTTLRTSKRRGEE
jgi:hypothetical protein